MAELFVPPLANPSSGGLYTVANVVDAGDPSRLAQGVIVDSWNCGPSWVWPIDCAAEVPDPSPKGDPRVGPSDPFTGDVIGADDNCSALVHPDVAMARAEQLLRIQERVRVEQQLVSRLLAAADTPATVAGVTAALGAVEEAMAPYGFQGVIHAAPHLAAALALAQAITRSGSYLLSPNGHRYAFGSGYADLGDTFVGTGPVTVWQGPIVMNHGPNPDTNQRLSVAEREVLVAWECFTTAVTIGD